ncbi:glycoside hydrolase family 2 protein [Konateibacter massiliensis]|uniref:glycoside hydrolase family 2 protein n=1 Tax=Konateibacter massiliensis TaxID=2002841 RepID=UPI000C1585E5|nr:glycoside hydrolase family 2 TIM barrel-domain containing protein [Konateibacter massiliensis]
MIRLFEQHYIRRYKELDGMWDFSPEGKEACYQMPVPGCWEQHPDFYTYRGRGIYSKKIYVEDTSAVRLEFKGVSHTADVYFDGEHVAHHYNAFTPFSTVIKRVKKGEHEIKVLVDNSFGEHSALHLPNDYYTYGGITRPVSMERISDIYIKNIHFTPYMEDGIWAGQLEATLHNCSDEAAKVRLESTLNGHKMILDDIEVLGETEVTVSIKQQFPNVTAWSNQNPKLYELNTILYRNEEPTDDLIERVGFRTVKVEGKKIQVNGEAVFLKGFNRHEDYAVVGCAIPLQLMVQDMDIMQDMGVNALRTCHYPNDERFLDLCDERGILVWEENHARGLVLEDMLNPNFDKQCEDCIREMIENHYNHPSIIIWGILNECASETEEGREKYKRQYEQIKELDVSRPTTSATCRHLTDICLDLPDIVSFNMYSGWYKDVPVKETNDEEIEWIKASGGEGKPIIVSELGAAAIYGYRDRSRCKWSEERQSDIIEENLMVYMNDENISGVFIWQFADCRVTEEGEWFTTRARCHNNKGVVDEYRRPKMAYDVVKKLFEAHR